MSTWAGRPEPVALRPGARDWLRILRRGVPMLTVVATGLLLLLAVRLVERPLAGTNRPVTPWITRGVCRAALWLMGLPVVDRGRPMDGLGAMVANHTSWLDIFVLNSRTNLYFVSKSEVAGWPGIGWLARATGTLFIRRDRREAANHTATLERRLRAGHRLLFFPEGTSTDGRQVLPFKTTLFQAFLADGLAHRLAIQPVTVSYHAPEGEDPAFYGWWGGMGFGENLVRMLAMKRHGRVEVVFGAPLRVDDFPNRKSLAHRLETEVRASHMAELA